MDFLLACAIFLTALVSCLFYGIYMPFPLAFGLLCFSGMALHRGFSFNNVLKMIGNGMRSVVIVLRVFVLIGAVTAVWRASGTIPFFVYYGISFIDPRFFILFAFVLTCMVSLLIGSSLGTVGTIGVVLMILAKSGGADTAVTAGAIIAGAYFGDRCAPTSSSANLVAALTKTDVIDNIKNMLKSAFIPTMLSLVAYCTLSVHYQMDKTDNALLNSIASLYDIGLITAVPALIVIILSILRYNVIISISISILSGIFVAIFVQSVGIPELLSHILLGYKIESANSFAKIISGGGVISMLSTICVVLIASGYSGIFKGTGVLDDVIKFLENRSRKIALYPLTLVTAIFSAAFGCNQSLSIILTNQIMSGIYRARGASNSSLALDIEDSSVVVAPLLPWNIAVSVPMMMLSVGIESIPFAVFLYFLPLYRMLNLHPTFSKNP